MIAGLQPMPFKHCIFLVQLLPRCRKDTSAPQFLWKLHKDMDARWGSTITHDWYPMRLAADLHPAGDTWGSIKGCSRNSKVSIGCWSSSLPCYANTAVSDIPVSTVRRGTAPQLMMPHLYTAHPCLLPFTQHSAPITPSPNNKKCTCFPLGWPKN